MEETSSSLEEMAAMTATNAEHSKKANDLAAQAHKNAEDGDKTMGQLNTAITAINDSSGKISKIIKVIEEIAFQTNLLALNAAVEAARAHEIVPGEVPSPLDPPPGCVFHPRCPRAVAQCRVDVPVLDEIGRAHWAACPIGNA